MAIKPVLHYRNPDSTYDLNSSQARIIDKAIFDGGALTATPAGSFSNVTVAPFIVAGYDGMVAISDATETLSVPNDGNDYYIILHLEYRTLTAAIVNLLAVPASTWSSSVSKNFFVTFAKFNSGAVNLLDSSVGDWADKLGKTGWRSPVANFAVLPVDGNRDGDTRITLDTSTAYTWQALTGTWTVVGGALDLGEVTARAHEMDAEELRSFNGSGYVGSLNVDSTGKTHNGTYGRLAYIESPFVADSIDLHSMSFVVNGHFVKTPYIVGFSLDTKPPPLTERHDLLYLDVWREELTTPPSSVVYDNDSIAMGTSTFAQVRANLEQLLEDSPTPSSGFSKVEAVDSTTFVVTRWVVRKAKNVDANSILTPSLSLSSLNVINVDGVVYTTFAPSDKRVWTASSVTSFDGVSWAIPLLVVRRTPLEGLGNYIRETRTDTNDERFIFDVAPRAELGHGMTEALSALASSGSTAASIYAGDPSGFLSGTEDLIAPGAGTLTFVEATASVLGRVLRGGSSIVSLNSPPTATGQPNFDLVVLEVHNTANPPANYDYVSEEYLSRVGNQGVRSLRAYGKFVVHRLNTPLHTPSSDSDETRLMTDAAISTGPYSSVGPGLWSRSSVPGAEDSAKVYAIPVALVNRRVDGSLSGTLWSPDTAAGRQYTNRNNWYGLPDNPVYTPYASEILDLRHRLIRLDESDHVAEESFDKLLHGDLRTTFSYDKGGSGFGAVPVFGTQLLQVDEITGTSVALGPGSFQVTPDSNSHVSVWSDADEAQLLSWSLTNPAVTNTTPDGVFSWGPTNVASGIGDLSVTAPPGMHLDFGQPPGSLGAFPFNIALVLSRGSYTPIAPLSIGLIVTTTDAFGNINSLTIKDVAFGVPLVAADTAHVQVWAVKPRHTSTDYTTNSSLFAAPDEVHRVELRSALPTTRVNVGPIVKTLRVPLSGTPKVATITQADVFGIFLELATTDVLVRVLGVASFSLVGEAPYSGSNLKLRYVKLTDSAGTSVGTAKMELEFQGVTSATEVDVQVICDGDITSSWVEINPASRGISGPYRWDFSTLQPFPSGTNKAISASSPISEFSHTVPFTEVGLDSVIGMSSASTSQTHNDISLSSSSPSSLVYVNEATSYTLWTNAADRTSLPIDNSSTFGVNYTGPGSLRPLGSYSAVPGLASVFPNSGVSFSLVSPVLVPLRDTESLRIFYTYTPYQGISPSLGDGSFGYADQLANNLHGSVEYVGETLVSTRGTNLPKVHPNEISISSYEVEPYLYEYRRIVDSGFSFSIGSSFPPLPSVTSTSLVSPDKEGLYRTTDRVLGSYLSNLPSFSASFGLPSADSLGHAWVSSTPVTPYFYSVPLTAGESDSVSSPLVWTSSGTLSAPTVSTNYNRYFKLEIPFGRVLTHTFVRGSTTGSSLVSVGILKVPHDSPTSSLNVLPTIFLTATTDTHVTVFGYTFSPGFDYYLKINVNNGPASSAVINSIWLRTEPPISPVFNVEFPGSSSSVVSGRLPLKVGDILGTPYTPADFKSLVDNSSSPGTAPHSGRLPRGRVFSSTGNYAYSPLSSSSAERSYFYPQSFSTLGSFSSKDIPSLSRERSNSFPLHYSSDSYKFSVAVDHWLVRGVDSSSAFLGVSTGLSDSTVQGGQAVDAFYPVGRPLFRKTK